MWLGGGKADWFKPEMDFSLLAPVSESKFLRRHNGVYVVLTSASDLELAGFQCCEKGVRVTRVRGVVEERIKPDQLRITE